MQSVVGHLVVNGESKVIRGFLTAWGVRAPNPMLFEGQLYTFWHKRFFFFVCLFSENLSLNLSKLSTRNIKLSIWSFLVVLHFWKFSFWKLPSVTPIWTPCSIGLLRVGHTSTFYCRPGNLFCISLTGFHFPPPGFIPSFWWSVSFCSFSRKGTLEVNLMPSWLKMFLQFTLKQNWFGWL